MDITTGAADLAPSTRARSRDRALMAAAAFVLLALGVWNLAGPGVWWDEGWTLTIGRNWIERGHYGRLLLGELAPAGLEASFTTTVPVALTMRLLGVGVWQGRLFGVVSAVAALLLLTALASRLYGRRVGWATLAVAVLLSPHAQIHPLLQGRQVLAEMPMMAYLLAGYLCLWWALAGRAALVAPAALCFGLAWISKAQTGPFLTVSLLAPILAAALARQWRSAGLLALALAGGYASMRALALVPGAFLFTPGLGPQGISGLVEVMAVVVKPFNRIYAAQLILVLGWPTILGALWAARQLWGGRRAVSAPAPERASWLVALALIGLTGAWLGWFLVLSVGVPRYMAPPVVVGSMFVALLLRDLTGDYDVGRTLARITDALKPGGDRRAGLSAFLTVLLTALIFAITLLGIARAYPRHTDDTAQVAAWLNARPAGTVVETYESELHFLLDQPYHYPPDQIHVELNRRSLLGEEVAIAYDPLVADPDYLVVGRFTDENDLYDPAIATGAFRLVQSVGRYEIYERVR